jgi:Peptidase family C25
MMKNLILLFLLMALSSQGLKSQDLNKINSSKETYLIIVSDDYQNSPSLAAFKTFREQDFIVQIVKGTNIGITKDDYRNYVRELMPDYILLVGKYGDFPSHLVNYPKEVESYNYYVASSLSGHPAPDIPLGLFFAENEAELLNMVDKTIYSENNISLYPDKFYAHAGGSKEAVEPWPLEFNEEILTEMNERYFYPNGFNWTMSTAYDDSPNDVWTDIDMINSGIHYMIYHGHGNINKWSFGLGVGGLPQLDNTTYPIILSFSCLTGTFSGEIEGNIADCFAQKIVADEHGAVAFFGAYNISGRGMNPLMEGVVNGLFSDTVRNRLGDVILNGFANINNPNTVNKYYPTVTEVERTRSAWQFHLFGNPALKICETTTAPNDPLSQKESFKLYPIPVSDYLSFNFINNDIPTSFELFDLQGRKLLCQEVAKNERVCLEHLNKGIYFFSFYFRGIRQSGKLIKE